MRVETYSEISSSVKNDMKYLYELAVNDRHNRYVENYMPKRLNDPYIAITIVYDDSDTPYCISNIIHRDIFNESVRVLNRFYLHTKDEDRKGIKPPAMDLKNLIRPATAEMINQQVEFCEDNGLFDMFFSTQYKNPKQMERFTNGVNNVCNYGWHTDSTNKYVVCNGEPKDCSQWISWRGELCLKLCNS